MSEIIIGFSRPKRFFVPFSWLIRVFDGFTPYSHTYIKVRSEKYDRTLIYQASHTLVHFVGKPAFDDEALVVNEFSIRVSDETMKKVMVFAIDHAGQPYDLRSVLGIAVIKVARLFGKRLEKNPFGDGRGFFCSELVGAILVELIGENINKSLPTMTPHDIHNILSSSAIGEAS